MSSHPKPVTRRQFMAQGLLAATGSVLAPNLVHLFQRGLFAQSVTCPVDAILGSSLLPLLIYDAAGGAQLAREFVVGKTGGQLDFLTGANAYKNFCIPDSLAYANANNTDSSYGVAFHKNSAILAGLNSKIAAGNRSRIDGFTVACVSSSDSSDNPSNPIFGIARFKNGLLTPAIGNGNSNAGGNGKSANVPQPSALNPIKVSNQASAQALVNNGRILQALGNDPANASKAAKVRTAIQNLSGTQLKNFSRLNLTEQIQVLVECGYLKAQQLLQSYQPNVVYPSNDPALIAAFGNNPESNALASVSRLLLNGYTGVATFTKGGYDNHDGTAAGPRGKCQELGTDVGSVISYAIALQKPVAVAIVTDGGMNNTTPDNSANGGGFIASSGDNDSVSLTAMMVYHPNAQNNGASGGSLIENSARQIGSFSSTGVNTNDLITATSPSNAALAMTYNWLALNGEEDKIIELANGANPFSGGQLNRYTIFKKFAG